MIRRSYSRTEADLLFLLLAFSIRPYCVWAESAFFEKSTSTVFASPALIERSIGAAAVAPCARVLCDPTVRRRQAAMAADRFPRVVQCARASSHVGARPTLRWQTSGSGHLFAVHRQPAPAFCHQCHEFCPEQSASDSPSVPYRPRSRPCRRCHQCRPNALRRRCLVSARGCGRALAARRGGG
jgi:hypothetical protein